MPAKTVVFCCLLVTSLGCAACRKQNAAPTNSQSSSDPHQPAERVEDENGIPEITAPRLEL
ncbi:MAG: hypothetical protein KC561_11135, partial [Myxococcales bacterium]|nr:hypothetical protein [Myxococcales bacterium]